MNPYQVQRAIEALTELKEQFDQHSDEYADTSMAIHYLSDPEYYETGLREPSEENHHERSVGTIGETDVKIVADGPKAQWCADVVSNKIAGTFVDIKNDVEQFKDE